MELLNPKDFGLHFSTVIGMEDAHTIAIVMKRKSRIIMTDGKRIAERFTILRSFFPGHDFVLKTSAPICSKTRLFLENEKISIVEL